MVIDMNDERLVTLPQVRQFIEGTAEVEFRRCGKDEDRYRHIEDVLRRFGYARLKRADKGLLVRYLMRTTGYSRPQLVRLIKRARGGALGGSLGAVHVVLCGDVVKEGGESFQSLPYPALLSPPAMPSVSRAPLDLGEAEMLWRECLVSLEWYTPPGLLSELRRLYPPAEMLVGKTRWDARGELELFRDAWMERLRCTPELREAELLAALAAAAADAQRWDAADAAALARAKAAAAAVLAKVAAKVAAARARAAARDAACSSAASTAAPALSAVERFYAAEAALAAA